MSALDAFKELASAFTGFSREAIADAPLRKAIEKLGPEEEVLRRARAGEPDVLYALCQAVTVGETFFFRHPDHFQWIAEHFRPRGQIIRAWSAGCATGEETYSIAACLLALFPDARIDVLGTDLVERNLAVAREARYGAWSRRAPLLYPVLHGDEVLASVRAVTRFAQHNLLDAPPGQFELVFCRNVLVYLSPAAAHAVLRNLARAVAKEGALFCAAMDVNETPPYMRPAGSPELQIWLHAEPIAAQPPLTKAPAPQPPPAQLAPAPRVRHLEALQLIERGERRRAQEVLESLPLDYLPALLERGLLHARAGEPSLAATLMREVARLAEALPPEAQIDGPEPLPARFYRESALSFLRERHA